MPIQWFGILKDVINKTKHILKTKSPTEIFSWAFLIDII